MAKKKKKATKGAKKSRRLTPAREKFVAAYLANGQNALDAYATAYPRAKRSTAGAEGHRLLNIPDVRSRITAGLKKRLDRYEVTADRITAELASIAFIDPRELYGPDGELILIHELPERVRAALTTIETEAGEDGVRVNKVKLNSKLKALELLGKLVCGMTEKVEHSGSVTNIVVDTGVPRRSDG